MKSKAIATLLCLLIIMLLTAPALAGEVRVSAAASLREVVSELSDGFARKNPGVRFRQNFGASGALARQIETGLPADIFISANAEWMDYLKNKRLIDSKSAGTFTHNTLVFAGAPGKHAATVHDLLKLQRVAIGSPRTVPAGEYAMEALKRAGLDKQLAGRLIMARDVRDCLTYAERGDVDGAFVYLTDALQAKHAKVLFTVPQELYPKILYPMALTATGVRNRDAAAFYKYLSSAEARTILAKHGFVTK